MSKEEFKISNKDRELQEMLEGNNLEIKENNTKIDIEVPKDKNKFRKGIALATAALLGTTGIGATAMQAKKNAAEAVKQTENIIYETPTYTNYDIDLERPYIEGGRIVKTSCDVEDDSYVQVFSSSNSPRKYGEVSAYDFNTAEYDKELYIPEVDIITYIPLDVKVDNPTAECTNFRMSPKHDNDNITRKISQGERIYIKPGPVKRDSNECWFEAIYQEDDSLISGYYCIKDSEKDHKYLDFSAEDLVFYAFIPETSRLYTKDEILNMYYVVNDENGLPFTSHAGDLEEFSYLPYGTIIKGTTNTKKEKSDSLDEYIWIQCTASIDGEQKLGYVPYSKKYSEPLIKRVPPEKVSEKISKTK